MSLTETLSPTPERLNKSRFETPSTDQKVKRDAYRAMSIFQSLYASGKLSSEELYASEHLERHYWGAMGAKVGDKGSGEVSDNHQPAITVHNAALDAMSKLIDCPMTWRALVDTVEERATPQDIGRRLLPECGNRPQSFIAGLAIIKLGLRKIANYRSRARERP